jgi:glucose/arabinose dehydrogenase
MSTPDDRLKAVFDQAAEIPDPAARAAFLDQECAADAPLRERAEALLRAHDAAGSFLALPAVPRPAAPAGDATATHGEGAGHEDAAPSLDFLAPAEKPGSLGRLAHYEILEVVGQGGMGIVLRAFDEKLHRVVAIKVMAAQLAANAAARKRFTREARAQAAVSHDHVVTIHAVEEADGLPYLVMQFVSGLSLQQRLDKSGQLQLAETVRIGAQTAAGLAAAHAQGLIHRDIKPANILLENGIERVKITDFGLARAADDASQSQSGQVIGTPQYMSPEQADGKPVDARSDLFSLGSVLYAMCTGRPPFRASTSMAVLKRVCEDAPAPVREVNPEVPDWLAAVIAKLHAKDPAGRYQSAAEVAELLGQHLAHVQHPSVVPAPAAVPPARPRRPTRRRWAVAASALLLVTAGLGLAEATGATRMWATVIRIFTPEGTLVVETDDPAVKVVVEGDGDLVITGAGPQEVRLRAGSYKLRAAKDGKPVKLDHELVTITRGDKQVVRVILTPDRSGRESPDRPPADGRHTATVRCVAYSPDGKLFASGGEDSVVIIRDPDTLRERARLRHTNWVWSMAFSPDSDKLVTAQGDGRMRLWDVKTATELPTFRGHAGSFICVAYSPNGRYVLSGGVEADKTVRLWDAKTGEELRRFNGHGSIVWSVAFSKDGRRALTGCADGMVRLWDVESGDLLAGLKGHTGWVHSVAFSPDGSLAVSGGFAPKKDGGWSNFEARVWDLKAQKEVQRYEGQGAPVLCVVFLPDGRRVLSAGGLIVRLWDVRSGRDLRGFEGHSGGTYCVALSPDKRHMATASDDRTVRVWDLETGKELLSR